MIYRRWTLAEKAMVRAMAKEPIAVVAKLLNRNYKQIAYMRDRLGIAGSKHPLQDRHDELRALHAKGLSTRRMAIVLGVCKTTVERELRLIGLVPHGWASEHSRKHAKRARKPPKLEPIRNHDRKYHEARYKCNSSYPVYTDEEREWLKAIDTRRMRLRRPLTLGDAFRLALELGYRLSHP